jgi:hypothetical protein
MNVYTDPRLLDVAGALDSLPSLPLTGQSEGEAVRATGTDGRANFLPEMDGNLVAPTVAPTFDKPRTTLAIADNPSSKRDSHTLAVSADCDKRKEPLTIPVNGSQDAPCRSRTYNPLIKSHGAGQKDYLPKCLSHNKFGNLSNHFRHIRTSIFYRVFGRKPPVFRTFSDNSDDEKRVEVPPRPFAFTANGGQLFQYRRLFRRFGAIEQQFPDDLLNAAPQPFSQVAGRTSAALLVVQVEQPAKERGVLGDPGSIRLSIAVPQKKGASNPALLREPHHRAWQNSTDPTPLAGRGRRMLLLPDTRAESPGW